MATRWLLASALAFGLPHAATAAKPDVQRSLIRTASQQGVPISLALAVAQVESGFNPTALSPKGARGVMQIMPATAQGEFSVAADRLWDADLNVQLGVRYLKQLFETYGRWDLALSHYNGGTVKGDEPSSYTVDYVEAVMAWQVHYAGRGCDKLTPKRLTTHADAVAICLDQSATVTAQVPTLTPPVSSDKLAVIAKAAEPPPPQAAPQAVVERSSLSTPATRPAPAPAAMPEPKKPEPATVAPPVPAAGDVQPTAVAKVEPASVTPATPPAAVAQPKIVARSEAVSANPNPKPAPVAPVAEDEEWYQPPGEPAPILRRQRVAMAEPLPPLPPPAWRAPPGPHRGPPPQFRPGPPMFGWGPRPGRWR